MKKNKNIRKIAKASLALLISVSYGASAAEEVKIDAPPGLSRNNYEIILQEIEELTERIHREVNKVLADYKRDTEEYHRRMGVKRGAGTSSTTTSLTAGDEHLPSLGIKEKDTLGISGEIIGIDNSEGVSANRNPELIVDMKEALAEKENPTEEYLKEKLFFKIFGEAPTAEQRTEIDSQAIDVYNRTTRDTAKVFVNQGLKLKEGGADVTPEQIEEGVRLGGEATLKQVKASIMASKILSEWLEKKYLEDEQKVIASTILSKWVGKKYLLDIDEVNAWIYLKGRLNKGIENKDANTKIGIWNIICKYIPKIIEFQKKRINPTWEQINSTEISSTEKSSGRGRGKRGRGRGRGRK